MSLLGIMVHELHLWNDELLPERSSESLLSFKAVSLEVLWNNMFCMSWCTMIVLRKSCFVFWKTEL